MTSAPDSCIAWPGGELQSSYTTEQKPAITRSANISVVIPVYNELQTIERVIERVLGCGIELEVILIDDGSTDGTRQCLEQLTQPKVRCYFHARNHGKGAALRLGFAAAKNPFIIVQDPDLEYDPRDYLLVLEPLLDGRADMVYGSRLQSGSHGAPFSWQPFCNRLLTMVSNACNGLNLTDIETGMKAFRRDRLAALRLSGNRSGLEPEITCKAARVRWRICEVPISYSARSYERSKRIGWRGAIRALAAIVYYRFGD